MDKTEPGNQTDMTIIAQRIVDGEEPIDIIEYELKRKRERGKGGKDDNPRDPKKPKIQLETVVQHYHEWHTLSIETATQTKRTKKTFVQWIWGDTGVGKSHWAHHTCEELGISTFTKGTGHKWWDGYLQQEAVIMDNVTYDPRSIWGGPGVWCALFDRFDFTIEYKGGVCEFNSKWIFITSLHSPQEFLQATGWDKCHKKAFLRRLDLITNFKKSDRSNAKSLSIKKLFGASTCLFSGKQKTSLLEEHTNEKKNSNNQIVEEQRRR